MNKLKIALDSFVECLAYMLVALLTMFAADFMQDYVEWWMALGFCLLVCLFMAFINYESKVYGYGFEEDDSE